MKKIIFICCIFFSFNCYSQEGITFSVENLSKPEKVLHEQSSKTIYENLISSDVRLSVGKIQKDSIQFLVISLLNKTNFALTPKIGWMIRKKDVDNIGLTQKMESENESDQGGIAIRVKEAPAAIFKLKEIKSLEIAFIDEVNIPERLSEIKIETLILSGKITGNEVERIKKCFPVRN